MIKVNEDVLRRAVEQIELDLNQWDQDRWVDPCNTTACLAGWIVAVEDEKTFDQVNIDADGYVSTNVGAYNIWGVPARALDLLGVTDPRDRDRLYSQVFMHTGTVDADGERMELAREPAALKIFKERITAVTGVEF